MYRKLGIATVSLLVVTLLIAANADDSPGQIDMDKDASPAVSERVQERLRQLQNLRHGAEHPGQEAAQNPADRKQGRLRADDDLLRRVQANDRELDDDETREVIRILARRVLRLEEEVRLLREAPPRIELLR